MAVSGGPAPLPAAPPGLAADAQAHAMSCGPACIRYVAAVAAGEDPGADACDEAVGLLPGRCVLTRQLALALRRFFAPCAEDVVCARMAFKLAAGADFDFYRSYGGAPRDVAAELRAFYAAAAEAGLVVESRRVLYPEITDFFSPSSGAATRSGRLMIALLDWSVVASGGGGGGSYYGHFCVVRGASEHAVDLWDPSRGDGGALQVSPLLFDSARTAEGTDEDLVFLEWEPHKVRLGVRGRPIDCASSGVFFDPLALAAYRGDVKLLRSLPDARAVLEAAAVRWDAKSLEPPPALIPLVVAAWRGHVLVVRQLIRWRAAIDERQRGGLSAVWCAAEGGWHQVVSELLACQCAPDLGNDEGETPLWIASRMGHAKAARLLLVGRACPDAQTKNGSTPLLAASSLGHSAAVSALLRARADACRGNANAATALHLAADGGWEECLLALLRGGSALAVGAKNARGATALHLAACAGHLACTATLLVAQADPAVENGCGATPLALAVAKGSDRAAELLERTARDAAAVHVGGA